MSSSWSSLTVPLWAHLCTESTLCPVSLITGSAHLCVSTWTPSCPLLTEALRLPWPWTRQGRGCDKGRPPLVLKQSTGFKTLPWPGSIFFTGNLSWRCKQIKQFKIKQIPHSQIKAFEHIPVYTCLFITHIYITGPMIRWILNHRPGILFTF